MRARSIKNRFTLFQSNHDLITLLKLVSEKTQCKVTLRRYLEENDQETPIWRSLNPPEDWIKIFSSEVFREIFLTVKLTPKHGRDIEFLTKSSDEKIVFRGGGQNKNILALWTIILPNKKSLAQNIFNSLKNKIKKNSSIGMSAGKHYYPDTFYPREGNWEFRAGFYPNSTVYYPGK